MHAREQQKNVTRERLCVCLDDGATKPKTKIQQTIATHMRQPHIRCRRAPVTIFDTLTWRGFWVWPTPASVGRFDCCVCVCVLPIGLNFTLASVKNHNGHTMSIINDCYQCRWTAAVCVFRSGLLFEVDDIADYSQMVQRTAHEDCVSRTEADQFRSNTYTSSQIHIHLL